jgi:rhamnosyltransferase subunit B
MRIESKPKVVLAGIGTKGDYFPLLALGRELVQRGYAVHLLSTEGAGTLAASHGLGFTAVAAEQTDNTVSIQDNLAHHVLPSFAPTQRYFREQVAFGQQMVVVNLAEFSATNLACELYGLPVCRLYLAPNRIGSLIRPPWPFRDAVEGRLATTCRKHWLPQIYSKMAHSPLFISALNPLRAEVGLPPVETIDDIDRVVRARIGLFPSWYAEPASDWPQRFDLAGFPLPSSSASLPGEFTELVRREGSPIVFTPGTGVPDVELWFEQARQCCEALGMPGVFLSRHFRMPSGGLGSKIRHFEFLDLEAVLKHAALLVHHGGIGTTARAFQAGVPQIVRARLYDQPDNGDRVARLGVGRLLWGQNDSQDELIAAAKHLINDPEVKHRLEHFRTEIAGSDGIALGASLIERFVWSETPALTEHGTAPRRARCSARVSCGQRTPSRGRAQTELVADGAGVTD